MLQARFSTTKPSTFLAPFLWSEDHAQFVQSVLFSYSKIANNRQNIKVFHFCKKPTISSENSLAIGILRHFKSDSLIGKTCDDISRFLKSHGLGYCHGLYSH